MYCSEHLNIWDLNILNISAFKALNYRIDNFTHLKLCFATATHNFKWVKMTDICLMWDQQFADFYVSTYFIPNNYDLNG